MAGIADMLVSSTLQQAQKAPDVSGAITKGAQLAQTIEQMNNNKQMLEQKKQEHLMNKANSITDTIKIAADSKDPKLKNFMLKNVLPGKVKALGMEEFFTPQTLEMLQTSDAAMQKVLGLKLDLDQKVRSGEMTGAEAYKTAQSILTNPEELAMLDTDQIFEAQKFSSSEEGKAYRAKLIAESSLGKQMQAQDAAPAVAEATEKARSRVKFLAEEKAAGESAIESLEDVAKKLTNPKSKVKTGSILQAIPGLRSDAVQSVISPETVAAKTQAQSALNAILRQTLGAQFTQQEGERVLNQIWDDKQPNDENARRILMKVKTLKQEMKAKSETLGASSRGPSDGDTKDWNGKKYMVKKGQWVEVK